MRRTAMMAGEKIADDLRAAHDAVAGADSPSATLAAAIRRLERRQAALPGLDRAGGARARCRAQRDRGGAPSSRGRARQPPITIRANSNASRSGCSRCAPPRANTACRPTTSRRWPSVMPATSRRSMPARRNCVELRKAAEAAEKDYRAAAQSAVRQAPQGGGQARHGRRTRNWRRSNSSGRSSRPRSAATRRPAGPKGSTASSSGCRPIRARAPGPMMKVASGGELARFLLALKVVLADRGSAPTLVFDEIDTGVGGAVADAIGARLARLADTRAGGRRHARAASRRARDAALSDRQGCA